MWGPAARACLFLGVPVLVCCFVQATNTHHLPHLSFVPAQPCMLHVYGHVHGVHPPKCDGACIILWMMLHNNRQSTTSPRTLLLPSARSPTSPPSWLLLLPCTTCQRESSAQHIFMLQPTASGRQVLHCDFGGSGCPLCLRHAEGAGRGSRTQGAQAARHTHNEGQRYYC